MAFAWIPHTFDTLPFFHLDSESRDKVLEGYLGTRTDDGFQGTRTLNNNRDVLVNLTVEYGDDCMFAVSLRPLNGSPIDVTVRLESSGLMEIDINDPELREVSRYIVKDISSLFRECFSPFYSDKGVWGRDQFKISDRSNRDEALAEMMEHMGRTSMDMVADLQSMVNRRLSNKYHESADWLNRRTPDDEMPRESRKDDRKARTILLSANMDLDSDVEDGWNGLCSYACACRNFAELHGLSSDMLSTVEDNMAFADTLHDIVIRRHELDVERFELEMSEVARRQADGLDLMSKAVTALTVVTTSLGITEFVLSDTEIWRRIAMFLGLSIPAIGIIWWYIHRR